MAQVSSLSPSDCHQLAPGNTFSVGGRVLYVDDHQLVLGDALGRLRLTLNADFPDGSPILPGALVEVQAKMGSSGAECVELLEVVTHPEPTGKSEFGRVALGGRGLSLAARSRAKAAVRSFFETHDFIEVDTPSAARCPGLDAHVTGFGPLLIDESERYLVTSPEFHMKRLLSAGLPRIYQICHCFRAEEKGPWHQPEFTMIEWYRAFSDWHDTMGDTEQILRQVASAIGSEGMQRLLEDPFERVAVSDVFRAFAGGADALDLAASDEDRYFEILVNRVEPALARMPRPVFLTHYPLSQAALARPAADVAGTAERYELYFRGIELCNGYSELTDATQQRQRFEDERKRRKTAREPSYPLDERFLDALDDGMPRASGNALGFDRLVASLLDLGSLDQVVAFSREEV